MNRRQSLGILGTFAASLAFANAAAATTARAVSLPDLVRRSTRIARATALDSFARSEDIGGARHIVTYSRLRIDEPIHGPSADSETLVRTLGGRVGDVGEIVHGEAELSLNQTAIVFLIADANGVEQVTAMAQGHYPLAIDASGVPFATQPKHAALARLCLLRRRPARGEVVDGCADLDSRSTPLNLFRVLPSAAAMTFVMGISANSAAYCRTYTCDTKKEDCPFEAGCNVGGNPLYWARSYVSFDVQKDGSKRQGISYDQLHTVVHNAFQRWVDADCGDGTHPSIIPVDYGAVSCNRPEYNKTQENQNVITFHDAEWPYQNTGAETLALTTVFFNPDTGEIYDANIELNSYDANFVIGASDATPSTTISTPC